MNKKLMKLAGLSCLVIMCFLFSSCSRDIKAEILPGDISSDDWISPTFTFLNMNTGIKSGERILSERIRHDDTIRLMDDWNPRDGDIFFFRGRVIVNYRIYDNANYGGFLAIVPLEENFYWNGVGLYQNGFLYQIMPTEDGLRIYNTKLWTLTGYCVIVQASSSLSLPENSINTETLRNIHKLKVKRGHLKAAKMNPNMDGVFTPPGLVWQYYRNQGRNIRKTNADQYIRAEDFIRKTDAAGGYFESQTPDLTIKKVSFFDQYDIDCSKVY